MVPFSFTIIFESLFVHMKLFPVIVKILVNSYYVQNFFFCVYFTHKKVYIGWMWAWMIHGVNRA